MNCWEWRSRITATVSVEASYSFSYSSPDDPTDSYTLEGTHVFTHGDPYTNWTRRELRCEGQPIPTPSNPKTNWVLRGGQVENPPDVDICHNRTTLAGNLSPDSPMILRSSKPDIIPDREVWLYFWTPLNGIWEAKRTLLLGAWIYPDLENDPYSVAGRAIIDQFIADEQIYIYADFYETDPPPLAFPPAGSIPLSWYINGATGTVTDSSDTTSETRSVKLSISFELI